LAARTQALTPLFDFDDSRVFEPTPAPVRAIVAETGSPWPSVRAASIVLSGCSWSCPYCFDPEHRAGYGPVVSADDLQRKLVEISGSIDGVVVTGGEPTESPALRAIVRAIREVGLLVRLDTNGANPDALNSLLTDGLVEFVALDVKTTPERYDRVTGCQFSWAAVERSIAAVVASGVDHEFRTTCYPFAIACADLPSIAHVLAGGKRYVLQQFDRKRTLDPAAASAAPWPAEELRRAAVRCSVHVPTFVRGV
jgi:pyruvate formate lyase activating enzyme